MVHWPLSRYKSIHLLFSSFRTSSVSTWVCCSSLESVSLSLSLDVTPSAKSFKWNAWFITAVAYGMSHSLYRWCKSEPFVRWLRVYSANTVCIWGVRSVWWRACAIWCLCCEEQHFHWTVNCSESEGKNFKKFKQKTDGDGDGDGCIPSCFCIKPWTEYFKTTAAAAVLTIYL